MARRKQEVQLQQEIETQEEWEDMLGKEGLYVVDVYQEWSGPCTGLIGNLRRLKIELGDDLLMFAVAKSDTIDALEKYRGRCEPCFLFYAGGVLVQAIRGANSPLVLRSITEQLKQEHKVLEGQAERKEIKDQFLAKLEQTDKAEELVEEEDEQKEEAKIEVTVAIIKPDAVEAGKVDEIISEMKEKGIEILKEEERQLSEEDARELYNHLQEEEFFEDLVKFMSSGLCHILVLTKGKQGESIIDEWRSMLGPMSVEEARETAPESWRAKYGSGNFMNALHGSDSPETAARELAFFFPNFAVPMHETKVKLQRTLALIRPDAFKLHKDEIIAKIQEAGFQVAMQKEMFLTKEQAEYFYNEHKEQPYFGELITRMTSGPLMALGLAREDAVSGWRQVLGPTDIEKNEDDPNCLQAQFAVEDTTVNMLHGSNSEESAKRELEFFFPMQQTVAMIKPDAYGTKDDIIEKVHEAGFRIAARKETKLSREVAEDFYSEHKDKEYFNDLVEQMCSGTTYFMVLSREDAVDGWRSLIGPTNPDEAREANPETLRAKYGSTILQNAVHGSSSTEHAEQSMKVIFGELQFNKDGTLKEDAEGESKPGDEGALQEQEKQEVVEQEAVQQEQQKEAGDEEQEKQEVVEQEAVQQEQQKGEELSGETPKSDDDGLTADQQKPEEAEQKPVEEAEQKPVEEAEQKPADEAEQKSTEEAEQKPVEEVEQKSTEEAEQKPADEAEQKPEEEAEQKPVEEAEQKPEEEAEQKPAEEAEQKSAEEAEQKSAEEAEQKSAEEAEQKPADEAEQKPAEEAEQKPVEEVEQKPVEEVEQKPADEPEQKPTDEQAEQKPELEAEQKPAEEGEPKMEEQKAEGEGSIEPVQQADEPKVEEQKPEESEQKPEETAEQAQETETKPEQTQQAD